MSLAHDAIIKIQLAPLKETHDIVEEAIDAGNPSPAFLHIRQLRTAAQSNAWAAALGMYELKQEWNTEDGAFQSADSFEQITYEKTGYGIATVSRYIKTWERLIVTPKYLNEDGEIEIRKHGAIRQKRILGHALNTAYLLSTAAAEGEMTEEDWEDFELAPNKKTVSEIRNRIRGNQTSSNKALKLMMEADGTLKARRGGAYEVFGALVINRRGDSEVIDAAIERTLRGSGIFERS